MKEKTSTHCNVMCNGHFLAHYVHSMFRLLRLDVCTIPKMKIYFTQNTHFYGNTIFAESHFESMRR